MEKKVFIFLLLLFLSSCGYEAVYSKKNRVNYNFSISELNFIGNREINLKIKEKLNNYTLSQTDKNFELRISSASDKLILVKDDAGDATNFKIRISVVVEVLKNSKLKNNFKIVESFDYNNNSNKFELKDYEKEIRSNLANTVAEKLIFKLSNVQ
tara:strand:- start:681 stop:1145 length:465 start_codon:yes stop_codon:yes gene_type:complete